MIHQNDLLALGPQQMVSAQRTYDLPLLIQHRIAPVAAFQGCLSYIIQIVILPEGNQLRSPGDTGNRYRLDKQPGRPVRIVGRGNDHRVPLILPGLRIQLAVAHDNGGSLFFKGAAEYLGIVPRQQDGSFGKGCPAFLLLRHGNDHFPGKAVYIPRIPPYLPIQTGNEVEQGDVMQQCLFYELHIILSNIPNAQHAEQFTLLIGNGQSGGGPLFRKNVPGPVHRYRPAEDGRVVVIHILHLGAQIMNEDRRFKAEPFQNMGRFLRKHPQPGGHIIPLPQGIAQGSICNGCHDGIRIRILVSCDIYRFHSVLLLCFLLFYTLTALL